MQGPHLGIDTVSATGHNTIRDFTGLGLVLLVAGFVAECSLGKLWGKCIWLLAIAALVSTPPCKFVAWLS